MTGKKRSVSYSWRLREIMAENGMYQTTELVEPLHERGIYLSVSQVHRLVTGTPERLSLQVLAALCDIFATAPSELIVTDAENVGIRKTGTADRPGPAEVAELRPRRARITSTE
ncbi:helix-turn-helix domain-containing protein [Amycolatopsis sp. NBC_00438]|uniref:helix-turn-helix domain-containing protein n=1 Tax=Amycolatopsis sp. NBC_00438 TaxID=2903558 RepID=UPI002E2461EE